MLEHYGISMLSLQCEDKRKRLTKLLPCFFDYFLLVIMLRIEKTNDNLCSENELCPHRNERKVKPVNYT